MSLVIFAEGTDQEHTDPQRKRNWHQEIWHLLATHCCGGEPPELHVVGFSKGSLRQLHWGGPLMQAGRLWLGQAAPGEEQFLPLVKPAGSIAGATSEALDILIRRHLLRIERQAGEVQRVIIAIDREPKHDALKNRCCRAELLLTLEGLAQSKHLAPRFQHACRAHLDRLRRWPREPARPARGAALEVLPAARSVAARAAALAVRPVRLGAALLLATWARPPRRGSAVRGQRTHAAAVKARTSAGGAVASARSDPAGR